MTYRLEIKILGPPGSGSTTIAATIAQHLDERGFRTRIHDDERPDSITTRQRLVSLVRHYADHGIEIPISTPARDSIPVWEALSTEQRDAVGLVTGFLIGLAARPEITPAVADDIAEVVRTVVDAFHNPSPLAQSWLDRRHDAACAAVPALPEGG